MTGLKIFVAVLGFAAFSYFLPSVHAASTSRTQLNSTLPEVTLNGTALSDALDFVRDISGANVVVNWKALEEAGITRDTPVTLHLRSVSLRKALDLILSEAGGGNTLSFSTDENVIEVTTRELSDKKLYTRIYPVDDLIMEIPDFSDAPDFSLNSTSNNSAQNPGGTSGGTQGQVVSSPFGGSQGQASGSGDKGKTKTERAQDLVQLIEAIIQPEIWSENGGPAAIRFWNGSLVVTAPKSVHEAIGGPWD